MNSQELLVKDVKSLNSEDAEHIITAIEFARCIHKGFFRINGEPYIYHAAEVGRLLLAWNAPRDIVIAGILHDVFKEDYAIKIDVDNLKLDIREKFGSYVISLITYLDRLSHQVPKILIKEKGDEEIYLQSEERKYISWTIAKLRENPIAAIVKIADRLHNLETVSQLDDNRQKRFLQTVKYIYAPMTDRLGMYKAKHQLLNGCLQIENYQDYTVASETYEKYKNSRSLDALEDDIAHLLNHNGIVCMVTKQIAQPHELYRKARRVNGQSLHYQDIEKLSRKQIIGMRIVVESRDQCYQSLAFLHDKYSPRGEILDYIANPKPNGYRALHTVLVDSHQEVGPFLAILMSQDMHQVAFEGITAKWRGVLDEYLPQITELPVCPEGYINVFTVNGDVKLLKKGANVLDFAYAIHTEVGDRAVHALVNNEFRSLDYKLSDSDFVDVVVTRSGAIMFERPAEELVVTSTALKAIARRKKRELNIELEITGWDRVGLVREISTIISSKYVPMVYFYADALVDGRAKIRVGIVRIHKDDVRELREEIKSQCRVQIIINDFPKSGPRQQHGSTKTKLRKGNPFGTSPVYGPDDFKGRTSEIADILESVDRHSITIVRGQERIGKTSLLQHLQHHLLQGIDTVTVYFDMGGAWKQSVYNFLYSLAIKIHDSTFVDGIDFPIEYNMRQHPIAHFDRYVSAIERSGKIHQLVIILDEFQNIARLKGAPDELDQLMQFLRQFGTRSIATNLVVSMSGLYSKFVSNPRHSSFIASSTDLRITELDRQACLQIIEDGNSPMQIEEEAKQYLILVTNKNPYYLKIICSHLFRESNEKTITRSDVVHSLDQIIRSGNSFKSYLNHLFHIGLDDDDITAINQLIVTSIAELDNADGTNIDSIVAKTGLKVGSVEEQLENLCDYGTVYRNSAGQYRISMPLLQQWTRKNYSTSALLRRFNKD